MKKALLTILLVLVLGGCVAVVEENPTHTKVKTFIIQEENALDILEQAEETPQEEKYEIQVFKVQQGE